jgi:hypothetical protein
MTAFLDLCCSKKELPLWGLDLTYNDMSVSRPIMKALSRFLLGTWRAGISWICWFLILGSVLHVWHIWYKVDHSID